MFKLSSRLFMTFHRENLILPVVSHQTTSIPQESVKVANKRDNDMVMLYAYGMVSRGHVDKTAQRRVGM